MYLNPSSRRLVRPGAILAILSSLWLPAAARADATAIPCRVPYDVIRLNRPLPHFAKRMMDHEPVTIVAIGSSSTAGAGASAPDMNYPSRLAAELARLFPRRTFNVINRGANGEEIRDMLRRFDRDVIANHPDLVLWQIGTNSLVRDHPLVDQGALIRDGINDIRRFGADVILIDPQFAPKVNAKPRAAEAIDIIAKTAVVEDVALFRRYDLMRRWHVVDGMPMSDFIAPDGLHMNDWSYACLAKGLASAIAESVAPRQPAATALRTAPR